jgi:hypothetical protein
MSRGRSVSDWEQGDRVSVPRGKWFRRCFERLGCEAARGSMNPRSARPVLWKSSRHVTWALRGMPLVTASSRRRKRRLGHPPVHSGKGACITLSYGMSCLTMTSLPTVAAPSNRKRIHFLGGWTSSINSTTSFFRKEYCDSTAQNRCMTHTGRCAGQSTPWWLIAEWPLSVTGRCK